MPVNDCEVEGKERYHQYGQLLVGDMFCLVNDGEGLTVSNQFVPGPIYVKKNTCSVCLSSHRFGDVGCAFPHIPKKEPVILLTMYVTPNSYCELTRQDGPVLTYEPKDAGEQ